MLILLLVVLSIGYLFFKPFDDDLSFALGILWVIDLIILALCTVWLIYGRTIDEKIDMYTEENTKIENSIDELVSNYMEFESDTFKDITVDSAITLVSLYPELKSDELVKIQIETYQANNEKIKALREAKIDLVAEKWWVYFGN